MGKVVAYMKLFAPEGTIILRRTQNFRRLTEIHDLTYL
jgi:hypothetical protein